VIEGGGPSRPFILRPVATTLLMLALMLAGLIAWKQLPLSALPQVDYPTIQVRTLYPGASPDVMALTVTSPLERQFGQMPGLTRMTSNSSAGASVITLQFGLNLNLDVAEQEVQAAINAANSLLPSDLPAPPVYAKVNPADAPVISIGVTSKTRPLGEVEGIVERQFSNKIAQESGVGLVSISGGQRPAVRITANVTALGAHGISLETLRTAISNANANQAKGTFDGPTKSWTIDANDQLASADEYAKLIVSWTTWRAGGALRRGQGGKQHRKRAHRKLDEPHPRRHHRRAAPARRQCHPDGGQHQGRPARSGKAAPRRRESHAADRPHQRHPRQRGGCAVRTGAGRGAGGAGDLPVPGLGARHADRGAVGAAQLVGAFAAMWALGYSINNLTLMALTIASGFVVDDAIVVIENIARHIEDGMKPFNAALKGASEIGFTIISLTVRCGGADPAAVHGRCGGPPVPRIRRQPCGHHRALRRGGADAGADAGRALAQARA
jgi:multidrug efflux pump